IGGSVSLITAALDDRVAGVATVAAFSPWRTANKQYESIRIYSHLHGFLPRLGFFAEQPESTPIDFGEIMAVVAPKPLLVVAPDMDPHTDLPALKNLLGPVRSVYQLYEKEKQLHVVHPHDINRLSRDQYGPVSDFFANLLK